MANRKGKQDLTTLRFTRGQVALARTMSDPPSGPPWSELNVLLYDTPRGPPERWRIVRKERKVTYWVSDLGHFAALHNVQVRKWEGIDGGTGYPKVRIFDDGRRVPRDTHALVAETFLGPRPPGHVVMHLNDDKSCNHIINLAYGTYAENMASARHARGNRRVILPPQNEEWRWHPRYVGLLVSNLGRFMLLSWHVFDTNGYFCRSGKRTGKAKHVSVTIPYRGAYKTFLLHRLEYEAFVGKIPRGTFVLHLDDNPHNNRANNLVVGTAKDNAGDRAANGHVCYGEAHSGAVYSDNQRTLFALLVRTGVSVAEAAMRSGIKIANAWRLVSRIRAGKPFLAGGLALSPQWEDSSRSHGSGGQIRSGAGPRSAGILVQSRPQTGRTSVD